jgi:hypothetical protein
MDVNTFLNSCKNNNKQLYIIIDNLIKNFKYSIKTDNIENDVRTVILHNYYYGNIEIISKRLFKKDDTPETVEYSEIYYKDYNKIKIYEIYTK